jgi:membrane-bound lytic murein transglycosylase MltF
VVDRFVAVFWAQVFPDLRVRDDVVIHDAGEIAWAFRKGSPLLEAQLAAFMSTHGLRTASVDTQKRP